MAEVNITEELIFNTEFSIFKVVHSELFSSKSLKIRLFIFQINNKIADAAEVIKKRKI